MKKSIYLLSLLSSSLYSQVGINTDTPTKELDVNGEVRIRTVEISTSTDDISLVVDSEGVVKKNIQSTKGILRAYLSSNFNAPQNASTIYKVTNWNVLNNPDSSFDSSTGIFTAPVSGLYKVTYTATIMQNGNNPQTNIVLGVVDNSTKKWITRFSIMKGNTTTNSVGNANTFVGLLKLNSGDQCYFGASGYVSILSNPSGDTGQGIGTYFEIELISTTS